MSQRAVFRGLLLSGLCLVSILAASPVDAQGGPGITFSPNPVIFGLGETSPVITATVDYASTPPTGLQTLSFNGGSLPVGITTDPSPVTFMPPTVGTTTTVTFRLVSGPSAYPGPSEISVETSGATGLLNYDLDDLTVAPASVSVQAGSTSGQLAATLGYDDTVPTGPQQLVFTGLPAGAVPSPSPVTFQILQNPWAVVPFAISTSLGTPPGNYTVTVGTTPQTTGTDTFVLAVAPPPAFSVVPGAAAISACPGGPAVQNSVTVTPEVGYAGDPVVTFPNLPAGLIVTPPSVPVPTLPPAQSVSFGVSAESGASAGPRTVNVLVQDSFGISASTSFTVNVGVPDFTPVASPASLSLAPGGAPAVLSVSAIPAVCPPYSSLFVYPTSVPPGVIVAPEGVNLEFPAYPPETFTITATESAEPGASTIEFTYFADGGPEKTRTVEILVRAPGDLSVAAEKAAIDVCPGGTAVPNSLLIEALDGYAGTPTVSFPVLPAEIRITPSTVAVGTLPPSQTVAFEVSAVAGAQPGQKVVNVLVSDP
ncbi:MAG: hypothetical protein KJ062_03725, partial [Thermoanaerobaculia bacterium]|nr:hypothetical protein [Thermoanaerobaculia bacterium]